MTWDAITPDRLAPGIADYMADTLRAAGWSVAEPGATRKVARKAPTGPRYTARDRRLGYGADILDWYSPEAQDRMRATAARLAAYSSAAPTIGPAASVLEIGTADGTEQHTEDMRPFVVDRDGSTAMLPQVTADL
jgi:hypothetical protein